MPQLSLYVTNEMLEKIEGQAKGEKMSKSKWVTNAINNSLADSWPENFANLFGSITDESFCEPRELKLSDDVPRAEL